MPNLISRRRFLKLTVVGLAGGMAFTGGGYAYATQIEPGFFGIETVEIPLRNLPTAFEGFKIAHISDLHLGGWMNLERMEPIVEQINALNVDLVAITGDFVHILWPDTSDQIISLMSRLQAREGTAAVLGNHDHWTDARTIGQAITDGSANLLSNRHFVIERDGHQLYIAGVDDVWEAKNDLVTALDGIPDDAATVLLAHEPDYADTVAIDQRVSLQLSGHSHGGQVRLPFYGALALPWLGEHYDMGLYDIDGLKLYVNRGVGMIAPYVRFNCRPEITEITLRAT